MSSATVSPSRQNDLVDDSMESHGGWLLILGIVLMGLGIVAITTPLAATLTTEQFVGWLLVISGVAHAFHTSRAHRWPGFRFQMLLALLNLGLGLLLLFNPMQGVIAQTFVFAVFFIIEGVFKIAMGLQLRPMPRWGWLLLSGVLALVLGMLIGWQWPAASLWVMGLLLGVDLLFSGVGSITIALAARRVQHG